MTASAAPVRLTQEEASSLAERLARHVPRAMRERQQWLVWKFEQRQGGKKPRKVPYYAGGGRRTGDQGGVADRNRLVGFDVALAEVRNAGCSGIGFAFLPDDGLIGIDIDGQLDDEGRPSPRAAAIIAACASYTELSPSRRGVHIIVEGRSDTFKSNDIGLEVFCGRQFFTVTGEPLPGTPEQVAPIDEHVVRRLKATVDQAKGGGRAAAPAGRRPPQPAGDTDRRAELEPAVLAISPDVGFDDWLAVGMALHAELGEPGFDLWDYWSSKGAKYAGQHDLRAHWRTFKPGKAKAMTGATIFKFARQAGWRPPRRSKPSVPQESLAPASTESGAAVHPPFIEGREPARDWMRDLQRNDKGGYKPTPGNIDTILRNASSWRGVLAYDEFSYRILKLRPPPFSGGEAGAWDRTDGTKTALWIERVFGFTVKSQVVDEIVRSIAWDARFHAVRAWLDRLEAWDGVERLPSFLADAFGAENSEFTQHVGTGLLVSAVARVVRPGCKVDTMVVFEGGQGIGKSTALIELFGQDWYVDVIEPPSHKDFYITLQGVLCVEIGEMQSFARAELTQVKQAITRRNDKFRAPYEAAASDHLRQSVFVGTTNADTYLMDPTGGRRFLPVRCGTVELSYIRENREQLWAEAKVRFERGFRWWDFPRDAAAAAQDQRYVEDSWVEPIEEWLAGRAAGAATYEDIELEDWRAGEPVRGVRSASTTDIMRRALQIEISKHTRQEQMRVGQIMRRLGWVKQANPRVVRDHYGAPSRIRLWTRERILTPPAPSDEDVPFA